MALDVQLLAGIPRCVAFVGARRGYPEQRVRDVVTQVHDALGGNLKVVSGGAPGVDDAAEDTAIRLGLHVRSFRPVEQFNGWAIEEWEALPGEAWLQVRILRSRFGGFAACAHGRNKQIAAVADIVVAMPTSASKGTFVTVRYAQQALRKPVVFVDDPAPPPAF